MAEFAASQPSVAVADPSKDDENFSLEFNANTTEFAQVEVEVDAVLTSMTGGIITFLICQTTK
jgi:hypothetical protein